MKMQTCYQITPSGVSYAIASDSHTTNRLLLTRVLKNNFTRPVTFAEILTFFNNDKALAFKQVCTLLEQDLIDINDDSASINSLNSANNRKTLKTLPAEKDYVLSDFNGFPVSHSGFNKLQAINISAIAYDFIKASRRSRSEGSADEITRPLSIKTTWNNIDITIYLLYFDKFSCLLTTKNSDTIVNKGFIQLASYLCNRYNYE